MPIVGLLGTLLYFGCIFHAIKTGRINHVRDLIGPEAEFLTYVFCACRRPATFLSLIRTGQRIVHDRYTNGLIALSEQQFSQLLEIEAANLIEQKEDEPHVFIALAGAEISECARREVRRLAGPSDIEASWAQQ